MALEKVVLYWPKPQDLIAKANRGEDLTSDELLALKSVSFYAPIKLLEIARGNNEKPKEFYVRTGYNILRELDECEDASSQILIIEDKKWIIDRLSFTIGEVVRKDPNGAKGIEEIIRGDEFRSVTQKLIKGAVDERAKIFVEQFGKGTVLRELYEIGKGQNGKDIKEAIDYCVKSMADGMTVFLEKGPIETVSQLHNYCYQVAGRIGSGFLNKLVKLEDGIQLSDELAEKFGEFLQLTNIAKNIRSDYNEGRRFFPREYRRRDVSYENMMDGKGLDSQEARKKMLEKVLNLAESNFSPSVKYIQSIPQELSGYKSFCLIPLIMAKRTIETMREAEAERVFKGEEEAIKIPHFDTFNIIDFAYGIAKYQEGINANNWLEEFRKDYKQFSFKPGEYEQWADPYRGNYRVTIVHG